MFVLVFMACDLRFVPKRGFAQALYGIAFSTVSFVLRKYCGFENSAVFGFLIASVFSSELDRFDLFAGNKLSKLGAILDQKISKAFIYIKFRTYTEDTAPKKQKESHKERRESLNKPEKRGESLNKPKVSQKKSLKELTELRRKSVRESQKEIGETRKGSTEESSEQTQEKLDVSRKESQKESQVEPHSDSNKESHKNKKSEEQK
jgi:hypothetical protein